MRPGRDSRFFTKTYACVDIACESQRRTRFARLSHVVTPAASYQQGDNKIDFDYIDGISGVRLLEHTSLDVLLEPLKAIQQASIERLPRFDPFLRIDPRINRLDCPQPIIEMTAQLRSRAFATDGIVHGDYHFGQLILASTGTVWLLDLDDLSMGPPEADLGNLIAHLSTRTETQMDTLSDSLSLWQARIVSAWEAQALAPDKELLSYFTQLALIRRSLKKMEQGDQELVFEVLTHYGAHQSG